MFLSLDGGQVYAMENMSRCTCRGVLLAFPTWCWLHSGRLLWQQQVELEQMVQMPQLAQQFVAQRPAGWFHTERSCNTSLTDRLTFHDCVRVMHVTCTNFSFENVRVSYFFLRLLEPNRKLTLASFTLSLNSTQQFEGKTSTTQNQICCGLTFDKGKYSDLWPQASFEPFLKGVRTWWRSTGD